jgi:amphi-Trp domain-containing protein
VTRGWEELAMTEDGKFVFESLQDRETIKDYFRALIDGIDKGRIVLATNGDEIELTPDDLLRFSVKVKKKGGANSLGVKITWKEKKRSKSLSDDSIKISS